MILGPVASDYNGPAPVPPVPAVQGVTIQDCDFGTPVATASPLYLYNVKDLQLKGVTIGGKAINGRFSG